MTDVPTPNADLIIKVVEHIEAHENMWNQDTWADIEEERSLETIVDDGFSCGATFCFAGWALLLSGHKLAPTDGAVIKIDGEDAWDSEIIALARHELGLDPTQAAQIFEYFTPDVDDLKEQVYGVTGVNVP